MKLKKAIRVALRHLKALANAFVVHSHRGKYVSIGRRTRFVGSPIISTVDSTMITIGSAAVLISQARHTALGVNHAVILRTLRRGAEIVIGDDVGMSGTTVCAAIKVHIGSGTLVGANVVIADTDFHPLDHDARRYQPIPEPSEEDAILIGSNVFIGTGAIILKGTRIGQGSVVGAGAVVKGVFGERCVLAGNPSRVVRVLAAST